MVVAAWVAAGAYAGPDDLTHTFGLRYRRGWVPDGVLGAYYYDSDDDGALDYERPKVRANIVGLEYTLGTSDSASFVFWAERIGVPIEDGYWDDKETGGEPVDHYDGNWIEVEKLGAWVLGANYAYDIPVYQPSSAPVGVFFGIGGGIGVGPRTGQSEVWHPGYVPTNVGPFCGPEEIAPLRKDHCPVDDDLHLPGVFPVVDLTVGPKVTITDHAMVRLEAGLHTFLYVGIAAGGTL